MIHKSLFILSVYFLPICAYGQFNVYKNISINNDLPATHVYSIKRSKSGLLYLCTDKGILTYNGDGFKANTVLNPENEYRDEIFSLYEDSQARIWLYTYKGRIQYIKNKIVYNSINDSTLRKSIYIPHIYQVEEDEDKNILFYNKNSEYIYKYDNKKLTRLRKIPEIKNSVVDYFETANGVIKYFYDCGIQLTVDSTGGIIRKDSTKYDHFIYTHDSLYKVKYNLNSIEINDELIPVYNREIQYRGVITISCIGTHLFICHNDGLLIYNKDTKKVSRLFNGVKITDAVQLNNLQIMVASHDNGLYVINSFAKTVFDKKNKSEIFDIALGNNFLYLTYKTNEIEEINKDLHQVKKWAYFKTDEKNYRLNILRSESGTIFFFKDDKILEIFSNGRGKAMTCEKISAKKVVQLGSRFICFHGNVVGTVNDTVILYSHFEKIYDMVIVKDSDILITSNSGLYKCEQHHTKLVDSAHNIFKLFPSKYHFLIYTHNGELYYTKNVYQKEDYTSIQASTQYIAFDRFLRMNDSAYIVTSKKCCLLLMDSKNGIVKKYLPNFIFDLMPLGLCSDSSCLFWATKTNVYKIKADLLNEKFQLPRILPPYIVSDNFVNRDSIIISYHAKKNQILFDVINYSQLPYLIYYKYNNSNWIRISEGVIDLNSLSPGMNSVTIELRNYDEEVIDKCNIFFQVTRPFYQTMWFYLLMLISFILLTLFVIRYVLIKKNKVRMLKEKRKFESLQSELKAMNAMMNPHFVFNTLSNLQSLYELEQTDKAKLYMMYFSNLIRKNMRNINQQIISLEDELEVVREYLKIETLRFNNMLHWDIFIDKEIDTYDISVPPLLIQPIVENAIKHGLFKVSGIENKLLIEIVKNQQFILITIKNNGVKYIQVSKTDSHGGNQMAIENIKKRIENLNILNLTMMSIKTRIDDDWYVVEIKL